MSPKTAATSVPVHPLIAERWSPRGFDGRHVLDDRTTTALLEAARWAPSANNSQPWRFLVGHRGDEHHGRLLESLAPPNRAWADAASALVLVAARRHDGRGRPLRWAVYDTGQAVAALSVQAAAEGLHVHQMGGFDADAVRDAFALDDAVQPLVVLAVGRRDPGAELPEPLASREVAQRTREPLEALLLNTSTGSRQQVA
ncbi:MAG: nitroreductase family protein [Actinomycetes bacterium]